MPGEAEDIGGNPSGSDGRAAVTHADRIIPAEPERCVRKTEFLTPRGTKAGQEVENVEWDPNIESHRKVK